MYAEGVTRNLPDIYTILVAGVYEIGRWFELKLTESEISVKLHALNLLFYDKPRFWPAAY
jgi:hypothetical protein